MFSQKKQSKSVIKITDTQISHLTIRKEDNFFYVDKHEIINIPEGVVKNGEILKADIFYQTMKKIQKEIKNRDVDVLLPHDIFLCHNGVLDSKNEKQTSIKRIKNYLNNFSQVEPWQKSRVCEFETFTFDKKEHVLFTCLQKDIQKSYLHIFKKVGLTIASINSDMLAVGHLFPLEYSLVLYVGNTDSRIIDFRKGMYITHNTFQTSYPQLLKAIMKNISIDQEQAVQILKKYGISRMHKDKDVYKHLHRSLNSLFDYFKKRNNLTELKISIVYTALPIHGLADELSHLVKKKVDDFNIFNTKEYTFSEIPSLPKKDSYYYQPHIAQALRFWKK